MLFLTLLFLQSLFAHNRLTNYVYSTKEICLHDFLEIMKKYIQRYSASDFLENLKEMFPHYWYKLVDHEQMAASKL